MLRIIFILMKICTDIPNIMAHIPWKFQYDPRNSIYRQKKLMITNDQAKISNIVWYCSMAMRIRLA